MSEQEDRAATSRYELKVPTGAALLVTTGLIMAGLVFLYVETYDMPPSMLPGYPGDAFYPRAVLGFSMIWAAIILVRGVLLPPAAAAVIDEPSAFALHWPEFASVVALVLAYALLLEPVGFEISTVALMMALLVPRLLAAPQSTPARAVVHGLALSVSAMLILYAGLGPALKIGLPLRFLPTYFH
jgi:hypothetical protein